MKVLTILARYGIEQYANAEAELEAIIERQLTGIERDLLIVDNALPPDTLQREGHRTLIGGDNRVWEFTAFDRGIAWVGPSLRDYDLVHFATSAFNTLYTEYLGRFDMRALRAAADRSVCLGHIDCYNEPVRLGSFVSQHWIRTCFFFLPIAQVRALGGLVSIADRGEFFSGDPSAPFRPDAPISANYQRYILDWLTGADIGQGVAWHSKLTLTPETLTIFEQKALCILNEQMLGIRLRALGCHPVDITWLATCLAQMPEDRIAWHLPWFQQLVGRDRDRVAVNS